MEMSDGLRVGARERQGETDRERLCVSFSEGFVYNDIRLNVGFVRP